jgi:hypothetical protein
MIAILKGIQEEIVISFQVLEELIKWRSEAKVDIFISECEIRNPAAKLDNKSTNREFVNVPTYQPEDTLVGFGGLCSGNVIEQTHDWQPVADETEWGALSCPRGTAVNAKEAISGRTPSQKHRHLCPVRIFAAAGL